MSNPIDVLGDTRTEQDRTRPEGSEKKSEEPVCIICLCSLREHERSENNLICNHNLVRTRCGHLLCLSCVNKLSKKECPLCRTELGPEADNLSDLILKREPFTSKAIKLVSEVYRYQSVNDGLDPVFYAELVIIFIHLFMSNLMFTILYNYIFYLSLFMVSYYIVPVSAIPFLTFMFLSLGAVRDCYFSLRYESVTFNLLETGGFGIFIRYIDSFAKMIPIYCISLLTGSSLSFFMYSILFLLSRLLYNINLTTVVYLLVYSTVDIFYVTRSVPPYNLLWLFMMYPTYKLVTGIRLFLYQLFRQFMRNFALLSVHLNQSEHSDGSQMSVQLNRPGGGGGGHHD